jgi:DNA invertase Pin-like site-specific DNA recombinase
MLIGYARVSTHEQNLALQKDALKKIGCEEIFEDKVTGLATSRPGINEAISYLRPGDTLVVWRLDRLGRSLKHLIELVGKLEKKKIGFKSLQESIDTTNSGGKLIFHIFGALAEFERNLIQERTKAGLEAARARGKKGGRPKTLNEKEREVAVRLYLERKNSIKEICQIMKISKTTLYSYVRQKDSLKQKTGIGK